MKRLKDGWRETYGPWAVVTGASSGIGLAAARLLAQAKLDLVLVARGQSALTKVADELQGAHGISIRTVAADLSQSHGLYALDDTIADLDVGLLVAAAGFGTSGPFLDSQQDVEEQMLAVNCAAVLHQCQQLAPRLAKRGKGGVVLFGSLVGRQGTPLAAHYAATKAYIQALGEALYAELRSHGIDVVTATPGPVSSGFAERADMRLRLAASPDAVAYSTLKALGHRATTPAGWRSSLLTWALAGLPRSGRTRVMGKVMAGFTAHQAAHQAARP